VAVACTLLAQGLVVLEAAALLKMLAPETQEQQIQAVAAAA
jgi:hypothetical protein